MLSSVGANNTANVESGPYTKAQFQDTMEGSRSVKNAKEVEQLLRDYPAALELYRSGRYKVKIKNEGNIERVILVEKRTNKNTANKEAKTNDLQHNNQTVLDVSTPVDKTREESSHSRTYSSDRSAPALHKNSAVQSTTSSVRLPSNTQPKVDHHQTSSKERDASITSQPQQQQGQQQPTRHRSHSRDSRRSKLMHTKPKGKRSSRGHQNTIVPYVPYMNPAENYRQQSRAVQPYYSNPLLPYPAPMSNFYMPPPFPLQQYSDYPQPYYYGQSSFPALVYQKPSSYSTHSTEKSAGNYTNKTLPATHRYAPPTQSRSKLKQYAHLPPSFHTFHSNQRQYSHPEAVYNSQLPIEMPAAWPPAANIPTGPMGNENNAHSGSRRGSKHRIGSVDTGPRSYPQVGLYNPAPPSQQQPPAPVVTEHYHHRRHHHHHRAQPINPQVVITAPAVDPTKEQNVSLKETTASATNTATNGEKLTIRQLNETFTRTNPSGRLPYSSLPNILQRFGIVLTEHDLKSAAQNLNYNTDELLSARRLVHILVNLGKIARSTQQQQQRPPASPAILPEDREVNDIMTQRRAAGAMSTHIHSSAYPNYWH